MGKFTLQRHFPTATQLKNCNLTLENIASPIINFAHYVHRFPNLESREGGQLYRDCGAVAVEAVDHAAQTLPFEQIMADAQACASGARRAITARLEAIGEPRYAGSPRDVLEVNFYCHVAAAVRDLVQRRCNAIEQVAAERREPIRRVAAEFFYLTEQSRDAKEEVVRIDHDGDFVIVPDASTVCWEAGEGAGAETRTNIAEYEEICMELDVEMDGDWSVLPA
ncbi:hypothetical protein C7999DRAFT_16816 [Corynascus novoguineensis]|uniref:Uncharacterized protein n=1 Tax=Corynascus novoguineensis TaxID=1126955 RepID=A0AAN7CNL9_9PEZI|nr:hypothetical protein C7999DRAFT_16816 [Corynascus novoguineensis]